MSEPIGHCLFCKKPVYNLVGKDRDCWLGMFPQFGYCCNRCCKERYTLRGILKRKIRTWLQVKIRTWQLRRNNQGKGPNE